MEIKKGDIVLVHSRHFLGRLIQFGMNLERWRKFKFSPFWGFIYNHAAVCVEDNIVAEAVAEGLVIHDVNKEYPQGCNKTIAVYRPTWTEDELNKMLEVAEKYKGIPYQKVNFIQYITKILFGIWIGSLKEKAKRLFYCTEFAETWINEVSDVPEFSKPWRGSPNGIKKWCDHNTKLISVYNL